MRILCCFGYQRRLLCAAASLFLGPALLDAQSNLVLDPTLKPDVRSSSAALVWDVLPVANNDVVVAGHFVYVNGEEAGRVVRINEDGSLDSGFGTIEVDGTVFGLANGPAGSIYIHGTFTRVNGAERSHLARLSADGSLDMTFASAISPEAGDFWELVPTNDGGLYAVQLIPDGSGQTDLRIDRLTATGALAPGFTPIVRIGAFPQSVARGQDDSLVVISTVNGTNTFADMVRRYQSDGSVDASFAPSIDFSFSPNTAFVLSDGSVLLGGSPGDSYGQGLVRLLGDGSQDPEFSGEYPSYYAVRQIIELSGGGLVVAADGLSYGPPPPIMRFSYNGVFDASFANEGQMTPQQPAPRIRALPDGGYLAFGSFQTIGGEPIAHLARFNADGTLRRTVRTGFSALGTIGRIVPFGEDNMLLGGAFDTFGEDERGNVVRLNGDDSIDIGFPQTGGPVSDILVDREGRAVVMGTFEAVPGATTAGIFRATAGNTIDASLLSGFASDVGGFSSGAEFPDGSIVVAGSLPYYYPTNSGIVKIRPDGSRDEEFGLNTGDTAKGPLCVVTDVAVDASGRLLLTGADYLGAMTIQGETYPGVARTDASGLLDPTFARTVGIWGNSREITPLPNGDFFVIGERGDSERTYYPTLLRFFADGSIDDSFVLAIGENEYVIGYLVTPDNALLVSLFDRVTFAASVRRFSMSGDLDASFSISAGTGGAVSGMAFDGLGRLWLGGTFTEINGQRRMGIARFAPPGLFVAIDGPSPVVVLAGGSHTLTCTASGGSDAATLQWNRNDTPIPGANGTSLSIDDFSEAKAGEYTVTLTDGAVSRTSTVVRVVLPVAPTITTQPAAQNGSLGGSVSLRVIADGLPAPTFQWYKDGIAIVGANSFELRLRNLTAADAGSYTVEIINSGGAVLSAAAVVTVTPVALDPTFQAPALTAPEYANASTGAGRADNSILVLIHPGFALNGVPFGTSRVVRMLADGSIDPDYGAASSVVRAPKWTQSDGTVYSISEETSVPEGYLRTYLRRVLPDGTPDASFGVQFDYDAVPVALGAFPDGRIVVGGAFASVGGVARSGLARLHADGTVDAGFHATGVSAVSGLCANPDGTTLVIVKEGNVRTVKRFLASGAVDTTFAPATLGGGGDYDQSGYLVRRRTDGSIVVAGMFSDCNGQSRRHVALLNDDGSLAPEFAGLPETLFRILDVDCASDGSVRVFGRTSNYESPYKYFRFTATGELATQRMVGVDLVPSSTSTEVGCDFLPDGSLLLLGSFMGIDDHDVHGMARLTPTGTFDAGFQNSLRKVGRVWTADPLENGRWVVAGWFDAIGAVSAPGLAVLAPDGSVDETFLPQLPEYASVRGATAIAGGRILVDAYVPTGGPVQDQLILLASDGSRDTTHDAFLGGGVTFHGITDDGSMFFSEPNPVVDSEVSVTLRRYRADFTIDDAFAPVRMSSGGAVRPLSGGGAFALCQTGNITDTAGTTRSGLCRLSSGGLVDVGFTAPTLNNDYHVLPREAPGGKCVIAGSFHRVNGASRSAVARLNADGSLDATFVPPVQGLQEYPSISEYAIDEYGRVLLWGAYTAGTPVDPNDFVLTRLNTDGSLDAGLRYVMHTFGGSTIHDLSIRENGDILAVGNFTNLGDATVFSIARITVNRFQANAVCERVEIPDGGSGFLDVRLSGPVSFPRFTWTKDGEPLVNGDRPVLALHEFTADDAGVYRAEVISADGSVVVSEPIIVTLGARTTVAAQTPLAFAMTGGLGSVRVDAPAGASWAVSDVPAWVELQLDAPPSGTRTLTFALQPNRTGAARTGTFSVAGQEFSITQTVSSGRLVNISTRGRVGVGDDVLIVGVVTAGSQPLEFLGRGVGPTLETLGVGSVLPNPWINLKSSAGNTIGANDDWDEGTDRAEILAEGQRLGAFDLADGRGDAAMLAQLAPGAYTALVYDGSGSEGIALAEFYDRTQTGAMNPFTRIMNISTRGRVGVGDDVLIAGFVITGSAPKQVLIRGVGPGLEQLGIVDYLQDPIIRVVRNGRTVAQNDDWAMSSRAGLLETAFLTSGAFELDPDSRDAALVVTLDPGVYTVILSGADGGQGIALVEVYDLE